MKNEGLTRLYYQQLRDFRLAGQNFSELKKAVCRDITFGKFLIRLQYNPARIISTNAKVDKETLQHRKCFLCPQHRPKGQIGLPYGEDYHIFINPYPIFEQHFTVPANVHQPQQIAGHFSDMLQLAFDFPEYTVFYNGPACGASAPDHLHFQMVPRHKMPVEQDAENLRQILVRKDYYSVSVIPDYLRQVILLQASDAKLLEKLFGHIQDILGKYAACTDEPMINLLVWFDNCQWTVCIFPRKLQRPWQFFAEGGEKVMFSPGCVDMGGLIIAPRQEDFIKYSVPLLTDLFLQVSITQGNMDKIQEQLIKC